MGKIGQSAGASKLGWRFKVARSELCDGVEHQFSDHELDVNEPLASHPDEPEVTENDDGVEQENQARVTLLVRWMSRVPSAQRISWIWLDATLRLIIPPSSFCRLLRVSALERQFYIAENGDASETGVSG